MTIVYVVTSGQYSDYGIVAIFSTKKQAKKYLNESGLDKKDYSSGRIEEYELDEPFEFKSRYCIHMHQDGTVVRSYKYGINTNENEAGNAFINSYYLDGMRLVTEVSTDNEQHAIKVANERRTRIIADDNWKNNFMTTF